MKCARVTHSACQPLMLRSLMGDDCLSDRISMAEHGAHLCLNRRALAIRLVVDHEWIDALSSSLLIRWPPMAMDRSVTSGVMLLTFGPSSWDSCVRDAQYDKCDIEWASKPVMIACVLVYVVHDCTGLVWLLFLEEAECSNRRSTFSLPPSLPPPCFSDSSEFSFSPRWTM